MSGVEVFTIVACVAAVISAYRDGREIIEKIKVKRAMKRAAPPTRLLEESIYQAPEDIEREKQKGVNRYGKAFEEGDHIAIIALQHITIELQGSLLKELRTAVSNDDHTDFRHLVDVADNGRHSTVIILIQLHQRLMQAGAIVEMPGTKSFPTVPTVSGRRSLPAPSPERPETKPSPTWTQGFVISGEEDAASGAENGAYGDQKHKRHNSLFAIFKHQRTNSHEKSSSRTPNTVHEHDRQSRPQTTQATSIAPQQSRTRPSISASPGRSGEHGKQQLAQAPGLKYDESQDNLAAIWGGDEPQEERQESTSTVRAPSPRSTASTMPRPSIASPIMRHSTISVPAPTAENGYLGFCKGAARLQNGDKKALEKRQEFHHAYGRSGFSQPSAWFLACCSSKCVFAGHANIEKIWNRVWKVEAKGFQFRWPFLAKSHVSQKTAKDQAYVYQCLFCTYAGEEPPVYQGADTYLEHVATHRGPMGDVLLYKTGCVNDHICHESEPFDINFFPLVGGDRTDSTVNQLLSDDLMGLAIQPPPTPQSVAQDSMFSANEPWNAGLSEFHWEGRPERPERSELE